MPKMFKSYAALKRRKRHLQHLLVATKAAISAADNRWDDLQGIEDDIMLYALAAYNDVRLARDSDSDSDSDAIPQGMTDADTRTSDR